VKGQVRFKGEDNYKTEKKMLFESLRIFSRTAKPENLKFTRRLSDTVQIEVFQIMVPRCWMRTEWENHFHMFYMYIFFSRTTEPEKLNCFYI
jgi:hypothetical protein